MSLILTPTTPGTLYLSGTLPLSELNVYNIRDFGATGNGVTNDTAAINAALSAAAAAGGGTVLAPIGNYLTNGGHDIPPRTTLLGAGPYATSFWHRGATWCFRLMDNSSPSVAGRLSSLSIEGSDALLSPVSGGIGIEVSNGIFAIMYDVHVYGFSNNGIGIRWRNVDGGLQFTEHVRLIDSFVGNCSKLIQFTAAASSDQSFGYTQIRGTSMQIYADQTAIEVGGSGPVECLLYNSRIQAQLHYTGNNGIGIDVTANGSVYQGTHIDISGEMLGAYTGCKRIRNANEFTAQGRFFIAGAAQPPDDYSGASSHQFVEQELTVLEMPRADIASAFVMTVPAGRNFWNVTGTTAIGVFAQQTMWEGRVFTLKFAASLTVTHTNGFIELAGGASFSATAKDTLTLGYTNDVVYEIARSVN